MSSTQKNINVVTETWLMATQNLTVTLKYLRTTLTDILVTN